jgi:putative oxidoreductase
MLASTSTSASTVTESTFPFVGRALLALLFIPSGWAKIVGYSGVVGFIASKGVPFPELAAAIAIAAELGLGLLLLLGFKARWAALGLAVFLAVITPIFHNFWAAPAAQQMMQQQSFYKNIAVLGGLLVLFAFGPGRWSVDAKLGAA